MYLYLAWSQDLRSCQGMLKWPPFEQVCYQAWLDVVFIDYLVQDDIVFEKKSEINNLHLLG